MAIKITSILAFLLLQLALSPEATSLTPKTNVRDDENFTSRLFRITGRQNRYVIACLRRLGIRRIAEARIASSVLSKKRSLARDRATLRCLTNRQDILDEACKKGETKFRKVGRRAMKKCRKAKSKKGDQNIPAPNEFKRGTCNVVFPVLLSSTGKATVAICLCQNPLYEVVTGRANFFTNASPTDPGKEGIILQKCIAKQKRQLDRVCRNSPGNFELLGRQLLEVCCKRARVVSDAKFQCRTAVPDDIDFLKVF